MVDKPRVDWQDFKEMKDTLLRPIGLIPSNSMSNIVILLGVREFVFAYELSIEQLNAISASSQLIFESVSKNTTLYKIAHRIFDDVQDKLMVKGTPKEVEVVLTETLDKKER